MGSLVWEDEDWPWARFSYKTKRVVIEDGVTSIAYTAFQNYDELTSVSIPNTVTSIGDFAFNGCAGLTSISIPNSVTSIGWNAFWDCTGLTSVSIPNGVTSIQHSAFQGCTGLTSVSIPNSVTSIELFAFSGCSSLTSINIPNSVTSIGNYAFSACYGMTSVSIPNNVTSIGAGAFCDCTSLEKIVIPESVYSIGESAFNSRIRIFGTPGSYAEYYAQKNGFIFVDVNHVVHTWDDGVTKEPTCAKDGVRTYTCTVCRETKTETIPATGNHSWNYGVITTAPTCAENGVRTYTCTVCRQTKTEVIPATGDHPWDDGIVTTEPTYTEKGVMTYTCTVCGLTRDEAIPEKEQETNTVYASNIVRSYSAKKQTFSIDAENDADALMAYESDTDEVAVDESGEVTIEAGFSGVAKITITAEETEAYKAASKTITITVPTVTNVKKATVKKNQLTVEWKKNTTGKGYEVQYSTDKKFKKSAKTVKIKKNKTTKTTIKKLKKGTWYVRIRTVNGKKTSAWSKSKSVKVK